MTTLFQKGIAAFQAGQIEAALTCFRTLVCQESRNLSAWNALGNILGAAGDAPGAVAAYRQALKINAAIAEIHYNLAAQLQGLGDLEGAERHYREAVRLKPQWAEAHNNLGNLFLQHQRFAEAEVCYRQAVTLNPGYAQAYYNLGVLFQHMERWAMAESSYRQVIALEPGHASAWNNLATVLHRQQNLVEAIACSRQALALTPGDADAWYNLGQFLIEQGAWEEAADCQRRCVALRPDFAKAWDCLCFACQRLNLIDEAIACGRKAVALNDVARFWNNLGYALEKTGNRQESISCHREAMRADPADCRARQYFAYAALGAGLWDDEVWRACEARWESAAIVTPKLTCPFWQGESLDGKRLLLWQEQGAGDNIMMFRYAEFLADRGAIVTVVVMPALETLFQRQHPRITIMPAKTLDELLMVNASASPFDYHSPFMGLPLGLHLRPDTILSMFQYLYPRPDSRPSSLEPGKLQIGIVWAGNAKLANNHNRSLPHFRLLAPLLGLSGFQFHSLYVGSQMNELTGFAIDNPAANFRDFDDTAAYIQHLDLVITVDTSVAHLAGALGKPVWILLPKIAEWRWYPYGETTHWYSSASLFIQKNLGDWEEVIGRVRHRLLDFASRSASCPAVPSASSQTGTTISVTEQFRSCFNRGLDALRGNELDEALRCFTKALELQPDNIQPHIALATVQTRRQVPEAAIRHYEAALMLEPKDPDIHYNMGVLFADQSRWAESETQFALALALRPCWSPAGNGLANAQWKSGKIEAAILSYRQSIIWNPQGVIAYYNLGCLYKEQERFVEAEACLLQAREIKSDSPEIGRALGNVMAQQGRLQEARDILQAVLRLYSSSAALCFDLAEEFQRWEMDAEAIEAYRCGLALDPNDVIAWTRLGMLQNGMRQFEEAEACFKKVLSLSPASPVARLHLGVALGEMQRLDEAENCLREALACNPDDPLVLANLGSVMIGKGQTEMAEAYCRRALISTPENFLAMLNLGVALNRDGKTDEALECYSRCLQMKPGNPIARYYISHIQLTNGHWCDGWEDYENRWAVKGLKKPLWTWPEWQGECLQGKRLLLWPEQGHGDTIMMFRYAELLREQDVAVSALVPSVLVALLSRGHDRIRILPDIGGQCPTAGFDYHCSLMSLPRNLGLEPASIMTPGNYLFARRETRPSSLPANRLHIGIVWAGNPKYSNDIRRSLSHFRVLTPLLEIPGTAWHSLQLGARENECLGFEVMQPAKAFKDFDDTAAFIQHLDLVITVDTAVAHLAGALGKPVWILLPKPAEWRWYPYGETTPWYPSARLFIQSRRGDWDEVIDRMEVALRSQLDMDRKQEI
jgi:tetratricopeptide (TPR) repeat protein